jgi:C-terminal peptidase prc
MTAMRWRLGALLLSTVCVHAFVVPSCPKRAFSVRNGPLSTKLHPDSDAPHKGRKRDYVKKAWGKTTCRIAIRASPLRANKNDSNSSNNNSKEDGRRLESLKSSVVQRLPPKLVEFLVELWEKLMSALPSIKIAALSFLAGTVLTFGAILIPVYNSVETLAEPVTLFETILGDLERGYVEEVDTQKLFETGISAMLKSLDPYTEFEGKQQAVELTESIGGQYAGVGLVISGATPKDIALMEEAQQNSQDTNIIPSTVPISSSSSSSSSSTMDNVVDDEDDDEDEEGLTLQDRLSQRKQLEKARERGIRVVSAFEGYAYDYGMRVGDKLLSIDGNDISQKTSVEQVRNYLRGEPGTEVTIEFERDGVDGIQTVTMPRTVVQIRDVKLATLVGRPEDGIGYIQLTGFASNTGLEVRRAILALQQAAEYASNGDHSLRGLILDMRGNPGGLLTSAVDVASLLVPKGSDIVSARGRGFPGVLYRSRVDPILDQSTKLAVLVNSGTASAAEIVSGAVQDLDVGVIVGTDRTYGKGLVQNVEDLPFNTALKFTVAKYYTPSGRCIQGVKYTEGVASEDGGRYKESKVASKDRSTFYTRRGREVRDGGGIEADFKVPASQASALEVTLLRSGVIGEFAAQWSKTHELTNNFQIDEKTYNEFQNFVSQKQKDGEIELEAIYKKPISDLKRVLKLSGYKGSTKELESLQSTIVREVQKDFDKYKKDIKEDLQQSILARYLPESMLIEKGLKTDPQVQAAIKLVSNGRQFDRLLAKGSSDEKRIEGIAGTLNTASAGKTTGDDSGVRLNVKW